MKSSLLKYPLVVLGLVFITVTVFFNTATLAQTNNTSDSTTKETALNEKAIEIFTSNTCEFCTELEDELKKSYDSKSYTLKNIDTSDEAKKAYQMALVACNKKEGTVPMFITKGTCISGKAEILETFKSINSANVLKSVSDEDQKRVDVVSSTISTLENSKPTDALAWYDYVIAGVLLVAFVFGLFMVIRLRKSVNKGVKLFGSLMFFVAISGLSAFLYFKVNSINNLASTGADAKGKGSNCIEEGNCADWNEFVKAKAKDAEERGDFGAREEWESKEVDQKILDQQKEAQFNSLLEGIKTDPDKYCGVSDASQCNFGKFLSKTWTDSGQDATKYKELLYGRDSNSGLLPRDPDTNQIELGDKSLFKEAVIAFNNKKLNEAYDKMLAAIKGTDINSLTGQAKINYQLQVESMCAVIEANIANQNCTASNLDNLLEIYKNNPSANLLNKFFELQVIDNYTGLSIVVPKTGLYDPGKGTDECTVPTAGGACPIGTQTCECQLKPVARYACGPEGQTCNSICTQTHNVCDNCRSISEPPPEDNPNTSICQESCSADSPCVDGTSCISGKCVNPSCTDETDCRCGQSETPICGDGIINDSPQAPEQCELGNPTGTSCEWDSCNQNTCRCPDSNPNWDIAKTSSVVCVNENTSNAYAQVQFNISATYINEDSPTTVGVLERVVDEPIGYKLDWLVPSSISNGGTYTADGDFVDKITWDLTGTLSQFTIPSGQTQVTKSNFLSYTFNVPSGYFGRYVNLVTGYPNQTTDEGSFSYTNSVFIACNAPTTALDFPTVAKIVIGLFLIGTGFLFAYTQKWEGLSNYLSSTKIGKGISKLFISNEDKREIQNEDFEKKILKEKDKE